MSPKRKVCSKLVGDWHQNRMRLRYRSGNKSGNDEREPGARESHRDHIVVQAFAAQAVGVKLPSVADYPKSQTPSDCDDLQNAGNIDFIVPTCCKEGTVIDSGSSALSRIQF